MSEQLTPIFHIEYFLDEIVNNNACPYDPVARAEFYLAKIAGHDVEMPAPIFRIEKYLAKIAGQSIEVPEPIFRVEYYLASLCGMDVVAPEPIFRIEYWLSEWASGPTPILKTFTGNPLEFDAPKAHTLKSVTVDIEPIQSGSGDPSPDNVRPITGWTGANVWRTGKNLFGGLPFAQVFLDNQSSATINTTAKTVYHPYIPSSGTHFNLFNVFKENEQYTIIVKGDNSLRKPNLSIVYTDGTQTVLQDFDSTSHGVSVTTSTQGKTVKSIRTASQGDAVTYYYDDCGIFEGVLTTDDFVPYTGTSVTVSFGQTVYGGTDEIVSGVGKPSGILEVFDDTTTTTDVIQSQLNSFNKTAGVVATVGDYTRITFAARGDVTQSNYNRASNTYSIKMCNLAKHYFAYNDASTHWYRNTALYLFLPTALCGSTAESVYNYLVSIKDTTPLSFFVPYADSYEPTPISTTPQDITTLQGRNVMWSDCSNLTVEARGTAVELDSLQSLNLLLGNRYVNNHTEDDVSDDEALDIILGGNER